MDHNRCSVIIFFEHLDKFFIFLCTHFCQIGETIKRLTAFRYQAIKRWLQYWNTKFGGCLNA